MITNYSDALSNIHLLRTSTIIHNALFETLNTNYTFNTHVHEDCELYLIKEGQCFMTVANQDFTVSEGEYVLIMPFIPHSISVPYSKECTFLHIHFDLGFLQDPANGLDAFLNTNLYQYFVSSIPFYMQHPYTFQLESCAGNILYEYENTTSEPATLANFYLFELILLLSKDIPKTPAKSLDATNVYINKALQYISQNYSSKIVLEDIASHLNISVRYLTKIFHRKMHISILTYLNTYRIHQAILLIKQGLSFTDIAMQVGFSSPPHFTKMFTQLMGTTPKQYRSYLIQMTYEGKEPAV